MSATTSSNIPNSLKVTSGPSTDAEINIDTPLGKYFARFNPNSLDAKINGGKETKLHIGGDDLQISFRRSVRVPAQKVDGLPSYLPPGLGLFPLYNVAEFPNLPRRMIEKGGVFMPIYRTSSLTLYIEILSNRSL